jgi:transcriptional regulator with XRE-family HTH domain
MTTATTVEPVYRLIGAKIEQTRRALGWTQHDLACRCGLTRASIANIELGRQRMMLHTIEDVAIAFQTTPKFFLRGIWL